MKKTIKDIILIILILIFVGATALIVWFVVDTTNNKRIIENVKKKVIKKQSEDTNEEISEKEEIDFKGLLEINSDTVGWIKYNKIIDYPILKSNDNEYYLNRTIEKTYNQAGSIFMDYRNSSFDDRNVVIYGHSMKDNSMFGSLRDVFKKDFFNNSNNRYIKIYDTNGNELVYAIFSYYTIESEEYYITTSFDSDETFKLFLDTIKNRSLKDFNMDISVNDTILTLSTCSGSTGTNMRKVIHAKRIKR